MSWSFSRFFDRSSHPSLFHIICLAAAYYGAGKLAILLAIPPGYTAPVWPSAGIALVGILLFGYRLWPGVLLGVILINLGIETAWHDANSLLKAFLLGVSVGLGASAQAVAGAFLVQRYAHFPNTLARGSEVVKFLLLAGPVACLISATWGVTSLWIAGVIAPANAAANWIAWWVGDALGVVCMAPVLLVWLARPRQDWRSRRMQVTLPLLVALLLVVSFFIYARERENQRIKAEFERRAADLTRVLQDKVNESLETLHALAGLHAAAGRFTRKEFEIYARGLLARFPGMQRLSWNPIVIDRDRETFEAAIRLEGYVDFAIREVDPEGQLVRANRREIYTPICFVEPYQENQFALGFDLSANPLRAEGLRRARDEGRAGATAPVKLLGETEDEWGVIAFLPIYRPGSTRNTVESRRRHISGYVGGAFRVPDLIATSVALVREPGIQLEIWDDDHNARLIQRYSAGALGKQLRDLPKLRKTSSVSVADQRWRVENYPSAEFFTRQGSGQVWSVLLGGLLFTGVLGAFLLVVSGQTAAAERLVRERTAELEKASKERADFTAMIVHDLRSPLAVIAGVSDTINAGILGPLNEQQRRWITRISDNTRHMTDIISDFLDVSQLEAGGIRLVKNQVDLRQLTQNCLDQISPLAQRKSISLEHRCLSENLIVNGDARWLEQLFWNLLSNAIKFTHPGGHIIVSCDKPDGNITAWVKDTGVGVSQTELPRLFEKYHQTQSQQTTSEKGTGLGLVICRMIVEAHGGEIWVASEEGKGSTFYVSLPL